jgi:lactoylglutathione lyase
MRRIIISLLAGALVGCATTKATAPGGIQEKGDGNMSLGNFSISLAVKDLAASRDFYEKLGFHVIAGDSVHFSILQDDTSTIGLFQGMFEKNILTFNPGWDRNAAPLPEFEDVRDIQRTLLSRGIKPAVNADESTTGPASITLYDPDGNQITIDQHMPSPGK